jgi:hypothetical protein
MRRAPWFVCGLLVVLLAESANAAETFVGVVGGGLFNNMPALLGSTVMDEPISAQGENQKDFGALGGVIVEWSWQTFGALRFEPKYMRKGTQLALRVASTGAEVRDKVKLDYVSLPLMFKSTLFRKKPVQLVLVSGLSADYMVSGSFQGRDVKDRFESWDYCVTARIGLQGHVGDGGLLGVQFNVSSSIAGIDKRQLLGQGNQGKLKNTGIGFAVEYTHSVGGKP